MSALQQEIHSVIFNMSLHHGHSSLKFGCPKCISLNRSWVCVCGCPNPDHIDQCESCKADIAETRGRCRNPSCEHAKNKHESFLGKCVNGCGCKEFQVEQNARGYNTQGR